MLGVCIEVMLCINTTPFNPVCSKGVTYSIVSAFQCCKQYNNNCLFVCFIWFSFWFGMYMIGDRKITIKRDIVLLRWKYTQEQHEQRHIQCHVYIRRSNSDITSKMSNITCRFERILFKGIICCSLNSWPSFPPRCPLLSPLLDYQENKKLLGQFFIYTIIVAVSVSLPEWREFPLINELHQY